MRLPLRPQSLKNEEEDEGRVLNHSHVDDDDQLMMTIMGMISLTMV